MLPRDFDSDPIGAILEFAFLQDKHPGHDRVPEKVKWQEQNIRHDNIALLDPWGGPAGSLTKTHLLNALSGGRNATALRQRLDSAIRVLESHRLIVPYARDANPNTTYRAISSFGRELFEEDSYEEFLYGQTRIVERWRPSVVRIVNADGPGIGTGFVITPDLIATAGHVVKDMPNFFIETENGDRLEHGAITAHPAPNVDLSVLQLRKQHAVRPFRIAEGCELLDPVVVFGYPPIPRAKDAYLVVNRGEISAKPVLYDSQQIIVVSCLLRGGHSGGPVLDSRGRVVGIVSRQLFREVAPTEASVNESLGIAAATDASYLKEML